MTHPIQDSVKAPINQLYIQEKNATSGIFFDSTNVKTIGDIKAIVSKALNNIQDFSIQIDETVMPNEMPISTFNNEALRKITYCVNNTHPRDSIATYISWSLHKTPAGNIEVKFRTEGKLGANNLPQMTPISDQANLVSATKTNSINSNSSIENYTTTEESLTVNPSMKNEKNLNRDVTTIGFAKNVVAPNQMYIKEKGSTSGVLFDSTDIKTVGQVRALITKALNIGEVSITILGMGVDDNMLLSDTKNKKMDFVVDPNKSNNHINTYFNWNVSRNAEGNTEMSFRTESKVSANNLPQIANVSSQPRIQCVSTTTIEPPAIALSSNSLNGPTLPKFVDVIPTKLTIIDPKFRLETHITTQARLHKIDGIAKPYITKIGVAVAYYISPYDQEIIMPRGTSSIYAIKGDTYNFIGLIKRVGGFTYGDVAICIGQQFRVRIGKITKDRIQANLPEAPELLCGNYNVLNIPMPKNYAALFDRVVVQYNDSEKVWLKI